MSGLTTGVTYSFTVVPFNAAGEGLGSMVDVLVVRYTADAETGGSQGCNDVPDGVPSLYTSLIGQNSVKVPVGADRRVASWGGQQRHYLHGQSKPKARWSLLLHASKILKIPRAGHLGESIERLCSGIALPRDGGSARICMDSMLLATCTLNMLTAFSPVPCVHLTAGQPSL